MTTLIILLAALVIIATAPRALQKLGICTSRKVIDFYQRFITYSCAVVTCAALLYLLGHILVNGVPHLRPSLFALRYTTENVSMFPALITTLMTIVLTLIIAVPLGIFSAVYLVEYAKRGSKYVRVVRMMAETLAGVPSIVYGLFGSLFFVRFLGWGLSLLAGSFTLSIMILPLVMRTTEESLKAVPDTYREGAYGLGAGRLRTVFKIVLPASAPGILAGVILAVGRIAGETAALIHTLGNAAIMTRGLFSSGRTLTLHMWTLSGEAVNLDAAHATSVVLLIVVLGINTLAAAVAKRFARGKAAM